MILLSVVLGVVVVVQVGFVGWVVWRFREADYDNEAKSNAWESESPVWESTTTTMAPIPESMAVTNAIHATGQAIEAAIRAATTPFTAPANTTDQPPLTPAEIQRIMGDAGVSDLEWIVDNDDPFDHVAPDVEMTGSMGAWFHASDDEAAAKAALMVDFDATGAGDDYNP